MSRFMSHPAAQLFVFSVGVGFIIALLEPRKVVVYETRPKQQNVNPQQPLSQQQQHFIPQQPSFIPQQPQFIPQQQQPIPSTDQHSFYQSETGYSSLYAPLPLSSPQTSTTQPQQSTFQHQQPAFQPQQPLSQSTPQQPTTYSSSQIYPPIPTHPQ